MAYKMSDVGSWGTGALGDITNPAGQINSYANVTAINGTSVTIGTPSNGIYETFAVGKEILLHVSALAAGSNTAYLGKYLSATITGVAGSVLTLSKDPTGLLPAVELTNHHVQAITIAQFATLNLSATIAPLAYNATNKYGGVIALKCKTALNISGSGKIDLAAKGIPIGSIALRPATAQESNTSQMGWENHITARNLYLNCPDGAAFIAAKASALSGTAARIGGTTAGVSRYPYNTAFENASASVVVGGPTILWASGTISGFTPSIISKTSSNGSGRGLGRCYIATDSKMPADECLYSVDCLSNPARLTSMGIKNFGSGALGTISNPSGQINSYAPITGLSSDGLQIGIGTTYNGAYERIEVGNTVMFHVSRQISTDNEHLGKFILAKVLAVAGTTVTIDKSVTSVLPSSILSSYKCQLVTVAQFDTLTISGTYSAAKAYDDSQGCGGILAIAAKTALNLANGILNMAGKGIPASVTRTEANWQCSGLQADCLPISQGGGAVFLLAKLINLNSASRIGAAQNGAAYGGAKGTGTFVGTPECRGAALKGGHGGYNQWSPGVGGLCGLCGTNGPIYYGPSDAAIGGLAGPSVFIVADTIDGFSIVCIATGGLPGAGGLWRGESWCTDVSNGTPGSPGGAGYGGGGGGAGRYGETGYGVGLSAAGGAGPGTCFIHVNTLTNPDFTALLAA